MTYEEAKQIQTDLENSRKDASGKLAVFPKGATGMTPDHVKNTPEFRTAKAAYNSAHEKLRNFNGFFLKQFAKEYAADRANRIR